MHEVASLLHRVIAKKEDPKRVEKDSKALRKQFQDVQYCLKG
jgi:glycine hydroxymethyltransferase